MGEWRGMTGLGVITSTLPGTGDGLASWGNLGSASLQYPAFSIAAHYLQE